MDVTNKTVKKLVLIILSTVFIFSCGGGAGQDNGEQNESESVVTSTLNSISFTSVSRENINITGVGGVEEAVVTFTTLDTEGRPISEIDVEFTIAGSGGGASLSSRSGVTDISGQVSVVVASGETRGNFQVEASASATVDGVVVNFDALSRDIVVSTGLATAESLSLGVSDFTVSANRIGEPVTLTVQVSDIFGNAVRQGTQVDFYAQGLRSDGTYGPFGAIEEPSSCTISSESSCSIIWRNGRAPANGVVYILATVPGAEEFTDANRNGIYDLGELFVDSREVFIEANGTPGYQVPEFFIDSIFENGVWDSVGDGVYNGPCREMDCAGGTSTVLIGAQHSIVTSAALSPARNCGADLIEPLAENTTFEVQVCDAFGNTVLPGSTITLEIVGGDFSERTETLITVSEVQVSPLPVEFAFTADDDPNTRGLVILTVAVDNVETVFEWPF